MQGIEILDTYQEVIATGFGWTGMGIVFIVFGIVALAMTCIFICIDEHAAVPLFAVLMLLCLLGFMCSTADAKKTYETRYQVIVYENCNITEFLETYEVVDSKGETWIVKDRNVNED